MFRDFTKTWDFMRYHGVQNAVVDFMDFMDWLVGRLAGWPVDGSWTD